MTREAVVTSAGDLARALADGTRRVVVNGEIAGMPSLRLPPGVRLEGGQLRFGAKGVVCSADNQLVDLEVICPDHEVAVGNDITVTDLGGIELQNVRVRGQVYLVADGKVRAGSIIVEGLDVVAADVRGRAERPHGFGVDALQGAFTIWNRQDDSAVVLRAQVRDVSVGRTDAPARGSGIFVGGFADAAGQPVGGRLVVAELRTGAVYVDGGIPEGTPDLISGGVFVQTGAQVEKVETAGPVVTAGPNDMALDNWGEVDRWTCHAPVTTTGPSGIGFVNFGRIDSLDVAAPIETFGTGARGFNLYDGSLKEAAFDSITTHGDGAIAVQVSVAMGRLVVRGDLATTGGEGTSLVRGEQVRLQATALSVKPSGYLEHVSVGGRIRTAGQGVASLELLGTVGALDVAGGVVAEGAGSVAARVTASTRDLLGAVSVVSERGPSVVEVEP